MNIKNQPNMEKQSWTEIIGRSIPDTPVEFIPNDVVSLSQEVSIGYRGAKLEVPLNQSVLVKWPDGTTVNYRTRQLLEGRAIPYTITIRFYDLSVQTSCLQDISSACFDAWVATFKKVIIRWKVVDPVRIKNLPHLRTVVESVCNSTLIDFVGTMPYNRLVPVPGQAPFSKTEIATKIKARLDDSSSLKGFEITDVQIMEVQGDPRRSEDQLMAQYEQARPIAARLQLEQNYLQESQKNALKKAETDRLVAEEAERIRRTKAEITAIEERILRESKIQAVQLQQFAERQRMQHEQVMKALDVQGQMFSTLLQATTFNNGGLQRGFDNANLERVAHAIAGRMPVVSFSSEHSVPSLESRKPSSTRERIIDELHEVQKLSGTEGVGLKEIRPGVFQAEIIHLNLRIFVICDEHYPITAPEKIEARWTKDINYNSIEIRWTEGMNLVHVVQQVAAKFHSTGYMGKVPGNGVGKWSPEKVAVRKRGS
jgi:hypothetical protein